MKTALLILFVGLLGGCANSALTIQGNLPGTQWVAEKSVALHGQKMCTVPRTETRTATVQKQNHQTYTYVRHACTNY